MLRSNDLSKVDIDYLVRTAKRNRHMRCITYDLIYGIPNSITTFCNCEAFRICNSVAYQTVK